MRSPSRRMKTINGEEMPEPDMSTLYKLDLLAGTSVNYACVKFSALTDEVEFAEPNYTLSKGDITTIANIILSGNATVGNRILFDLI